MGKRIILIDCDPGVDDVVMLAYAAAHRAELDVRMISVVSGNQSIDKVTGNALKLAAFYRMDVPVAKGAEGPLVRKPEYAPETHGDSGIGNCVLPETEKKAEPEHSVLCMKKCLDELGEDQRADIVATGPLTNIALLLKLFPEAKAKIRQILFMGGSFSGGNVTPAAEFNMYTDPEAAKIVLHSGVPLVMAGLDVTEQCTLTRAQILKLCQSGNPAARVCGDMMGFSLENSSEKYRGETSVHDVVPLMYLLQPSIFEGGKKLAEVDCSDGAGRGATLGGFYWWRNEESEANVFVLTSVKQEEFRQELITALYELGAGLAGA